MYTQDEFNTKYLEEVGEELLESNEASFSDAYRHAVLVNVKTLDVIPLSAEERNGLPNVPTSDHIISWTTVQMLPLLLANSDFVILHGDTEDSLEFFFPVPTAPRKSKSKSKTRKNRRKNY